MPSLWRRWRASLITGVAVWVVSFPLFLLHPAAGTGLPAASTSPREATVAPDVDSGLRPHARPSVGLALRIGALAAQPASPAALSTSPVATSAPGGRLVAVVAPSIGRNRIVIPRLGLNQPVGWYSDCLGRAPVPRWGAWRWSCVGTNNTYVLAHNPGVFTPILDLRRGDIIEYGDPSGHVHTFRVTLTTIVSNTQLWPLGATAVPSLTLQTCWTWDGSRDFIVRAVEV